jgi:hypothetical protein
MISREDFIFTIGYDGATAIVDAKARSQYGKMSTSQLMEHSLFRAAFASTLYSGDPEDFRNFTDAFNAKAGLSYTEQESFKRLFGIKIEEVRRVLAL